MLLKRASPRSRTSTRPTTDVPPSSGDRLQSEAGPDQAAADEAQELAAAAPVDPQAFAKLYGEPLFQVPQDLYIPPDALEVFLEAFEGPLDLLLYLIRKQNFNILDIPMAELTRQYLGYIDEIRLHNLELAAEYLLMAAMLIAIKSRMLLPRKQDAEEEDAEDPRAALVRRLIEYERFKLAAQQLDKIPQLGRDFIAAQVHIEVALNKRFPEVSIAEIQQAWLDILKRAKLNQHHRISREPLSVREHMSIILRRLRERRFFEFTELFTEQLQAGGGVPIVVVHFMALLELVREALVELTQAEPFAPIYVRLAFEAREIRE